MNYSKPRSQKPQSIEAFLKPCSFQQSSLRGSLSGLQQSQPSAFARLCRALKEEELNVKI